MVEYIASGYTENGDKVVLWRTADYTYHIDISGKKVVLLSDTEYYDALDKFMELTLKGFVEVA